MLVSVIIPTYKRVAALKKAVESVYQQTYKNYEIIVVNDSPADQQEIDKLKDQFTDLIVLHHPCPKGGNAARNTGIKESKGDILAFLDDDDTWLPEKLAVHVSTHQQSPLAGLVFSNCLYVYDNGARRSHATSYDLKEKALDLMKKGSFCPATTSMVTISRDCVEACGLFDENLVSFQDWDYWFRIGHLYEFVHVSKVLVHFRQHREDRTSQNEQKRVKGIEQICRKWENEINRKQFSKSFIGNMYYKTAFNLLLDGKKLASLKKGLRLFRKEAFGIQSCKSFASLSLQMLRKTNMLSFGTFL
jgi:glycosyltransferase involved in cell wall biosynthesis